MAYADDLLFLVSNPEVSLPNLMSNFQYYWSLPNYQINYIGILQLKCKFIERET